MRTLSAWRQAVLAASVLVLAGCGVFSEPETRPCPRVSVLNEAERITQYKPGPGRDLIDVTFEGKVSGVRSDCKFDGDLLTVGSEIAFTLERGPAAEGREVEFAVFIAVTDSAQAILAKEVFQSKVAFPEGLRRTSGTEEFEQVIPLAEGETGDDYEIIVGFQLSGEQLELNRSRRF